MTIEVRLEYSEKLNKLKKCSITGPQNLGSGERGPQGPLDLHLPLSQLYTQVDS